MSRILLRSSRLRPSWLRFNTGVLIGTIKAILAGRARMKTRTDCQDQIIGSARLTEPWNAECLKSMTKSSDAKASL